MPGRARFSVTISHRHGVFLCFFLIQGAFLWDGLGRDVDVHLHLRHIYDIYDTTSRMGWDGLRRVNNFGRLAPSKSHVDPLAMQRLLDKPGLEAVLQAMQFYVCLV